MIPFVDTREENKGLFKIARVEQTFAARKSHLSRAARFCSAKAHVYHFN